jgi:quinol monooxygenase YgiN
MEVLMSKLMMFAKVKTQPGKREEVKELWEKHVKPHQESEKALDICCYCYAMEDEDTVCLFELMSDPSAFRDSMQSEWFAAYQEALRPLLAGPPEIITATPIWAKGVTL